MLPDSSVSGPHADPLPALEGMEQRELLDAVRLVQSLLSDTRGPGAAPEDMRELLVALLEEGKPTGAAVARTDAGEVGCSPTAGRSEHRTDTGAAPQVPAGAEGPGQTATVGTGTEPEARPPRQGALI